MSSSIPNGMQQILETIDSQLSALEPLVGSGDPQVMDQYQALCGWMNTVSADAKQLNLPQSVLQQFNAVQQELSSAVQNGSFTSDASEKIETACGMIDNIVESS